MNKEVKISRAALKQLLRVPKYIAIKLKAWVEDIEARGLEEVRKVPGYHDEPLHGDRQGQRSIRLSRSYRAIYVIMENGNIKFISVEEVSKHDY